MRFIDIHQDRWHALGGEDARRSASPCGEPAARPGAVARRARQRPANCAGGPQALPTTTTPKTAADLPPRAWSNAAGLPEVGRRPRLQPGRAAALAATASRGEIRATGDVLVDQLVPLLARTGFDAAVRQRARPPSIAGRARSVRSSRLHYQGDVGDNRPLFARERGAEGGGEGGRVRQRGSLDMSAIALHVRAPRHRGFDERVAETVAVLRERRRRTRRPIVQATSLGAEDMVITDLIARHQPADRGGARWTPAGCTRRRWR